MTRWLDRTHVVRRDQLLGIGLVLLNEAFRDLTGGRYPAIDGLLFVGAVVLITRGWLHRTDR